MDYYFIGDPELVTAFKFVGINGASVSGISQAKAVFRRLTEGYDETTNTVFPGIEKIRVLILTEEVSVWLGDLLIEWQLSDKYPLIVEMPPLVGHHPGRKTLVEQIREAIGISI